MQSLQLHSGVTIVLIRVKNAGFQLFLTEVKNEGIRRMNLVCSKLAILKPGHCKWFSDVASTVISGKNIFRINIIDGNTILLFLEVTTFLEKTFTDFIGF